MKPSSSAQAHSSHRFIAASGARQPLREPIELGATLARAGLLAATAVLLHCGLSRAGVPGRLAAVGMMQVACAAMLALRARRRGAGAWAGLALLPCLALPACLSIPRMGLVATLLASHTVLYIGLAAMFGLTLLPGRVPLVTAMAREMEPLLTRRMLAYTRRVTWLWTLYGPAQIAISLLLLAMAPLRIWSMFINLLDLPLLAAVFLGEFAFRRWWLQGESRASLADGWRAVRGRWPAMPGTRDAG